MPVENIAKTEKPDLVPQYVVASLHLQYTLCKEALWGLFIQSTIGWQMVNMVTAKQI